MSSDDEHALFEYSRRGNLKEVAELLSQGTKPDGYMLYDGTSSLLTAARAGHLDVVEALIKAGASLELRTEDGSNALIHAVSGGNETVIQLLLAAGVNVNEPNEDGLTAVMLAATYEKVGVMTALLDAGADPNISAPGWGAALDCAKPGTRSVEILKSRGARPGDKTERVAAAGEHFTYGCFDGEVNPMEQLASAQAPAANAAPAGPSERAIAWQNASAVSTTTTPAHSLGPIERLAQMCKQICGIDLLGGGPPALPATPANHATPAGTLRLLQRLRCAPGSEPRQLGRTGLYVSPVGFGCHRLGDSPSEADALKGALKLGVNLIDTAPNYTDGVAESTVGSVLKELFAEGELQRDEVVIVTKVGNIVGNTLEKVKAEGGVDGAARVRNDVWHCISPAWIEREITGSLQRIGVTCLDVLLLHCPEFASNADDVDMDEVYSRITRACQHLESEVANGRICRYGITAAFYPLRPSDSKHLDLSRILPSLPASNHFHVLQFPLNFAEPHPLLKSQVPRNPDCSAIVLEDNQRPTLVELARQHGIATLVNRPLDGVYQEVVGSIRFTSDVPFNSAMQAEDVDQLEDNLARFCPGVKFSEEEERVTEQLAAKTVRTLAALDGVDCVLVGMRQPVYVASVLRGLAGGSLDPQSALAGVRSMHDSLGAWMCMASNSHDHGTAKDWRLPPKPDWDNAVVGS